MSKLREMVKRIIKEETSNGYSNEVTELVVLYITNERKLYDLFSRKKNNTMDAEKYFQMLKSLNREGYNEIMEIINPTASHKGGPPPNQRFSRKQTINWEEVVHELNNRN